MKLFMQRPNKTLQSGIIKLAPFLKNTQKLRQLHQTAVLGVMSKYKGMILIKQRCAL